MSMNAYRRWLENHKAQPTVDQKIPASDPIEITVEATAPARLETATSGYVADADAVITEDLGETTVASTEDKYIVRLNPLNLGTINLGEELPELPNKVVAVTNQSTGVIVDVEWDGDFDPNRLGKQRIGGTVIIPEDYVFECPAYATATLKVKAAKK